MKIKNEKSITKKIPIKSLGNVPLNSSNRDLMIESDPKANIMKYIKDIRTNILTGTNGKVISIFSCNPKEGKSWIANNLAVSMARINKRVLLIDANLRKASNKNEIFYTKQQEGLSDFIRDIESDNMIENLYKTKKYIQQTQIPNLYILQNGTITSSSSELIKSKKMKILLKLFKEMYDYIILDGTSFFENSDCISLAKIVDTNILIVEKDKTKIEDLLEIKEEFENYNYEISGFILNKTNIKRGKYYAKTSNPKYGMYIETTKEEENKNEMTLDEIINPIVERLKSSETKEFDILHKEIKDNIMIEDFINDIEVNFNVKLDNIQKGNKENVDILLSKINEVEENINEELNNYKYIKSKEHNIYEEKYNELLKEVKDLIYETNEFKIEQEKLQKGYFTEIIEQIQNKNYDKEFEEIKTILDSVNYSEQIKEINTKLESLNYREQIEEINAKLESFNYREQIEEIKQRVENIENKDRDKEPEEAKKSNIINLRNLFLENRKKNVKEKVFSIEEPISFEELERLAIEVIEFDEIDKSEKEIYNIL